MPVKTKADLRTVVEELMAGRDGKNVVCARETPERPARYGEWPDGLDERLIEAMRARGAAFPYTHQAAAMRAAMAGRSVATVTPTASGKSLCYILPALDAALKDERARSLFLFPTKALAQDQAAEIQEIVEALGGGIAAHTYDGDTPPNTRKTIRSAGNIVATNPDMLHGGILPHHTKWTHLFRDLRYVAIDEIHSYSGVFGSHLANVIRRLKRVAAFYGSRPVFILSSATIANPKELAEKLIGEPVELADENGAPLGRKIFMLYNPPVTNREMGARANALLEASKIVDRLLGNETSTIVFARSRKAAEHMLTYMKEGMTARRQDPERVRGYRGGYLPKRRREIERELRSGEALGVASTNALELGVDIGSLEACVMVGYPGSIASARQQSGRAGRRNELSFTAMVGASDPLDQHVMQHPEYLFETPPENGNIDPDNVQILAEHIKCAAFELPFREGESFGGSAYTAAALQVLEEARFVHFSGGQWHWATEVYPADRVSLRSADAENFTVMDSTDDNRIIGEVDYSSAPAFLHEKAIYQVESRQYFVERLDWDARRAYVKPVEVDYYTEANSESRIHVLEEFRREERTGRTSHFGVARVATTTSMFKKIRYHTLETVGSGPVATPELEKQTIAWWLSLTDDAADRLESANVNLKTGLLAVKNLLKNLVPAHILCARQDIGGVMETRSPLNGRPTVYLYDAYPGGVGISEKIYELEPRILRGCLDHVKACPCEAGCPSCVGPVHAVGSKGKRHAMEVLEALV